MASDTITVTEIERVPLGTIASVSAGGTPSRSEPSYWNGTIPWITTSQVDFGVIESATEFITDAGLAGSSAKLFPAGTVVMAMFGQGVTRGKVGILGIDAAFNQACVAIVPTKGDDSRFLYHHLEHDYERIRRLSQAGTQSNLNAEIIKSLPIVRFPVDEQAVLASIGDRCDYAALLADRITDAKRKLLRGLMQQLLTGRRRLPAFAGEAWEEDHLGDLFAERAETGRTDLPLLSITAERGVIPRGEIERKDTSNADKSKYKRIAPGDIGYNTMRMWQGVSALSSLEGIVSPAYTICIPGPKIDGRFARWFFKFPPVVNLFYRYSQGLVDDTLNLKYPHFAEIKVRVPTSLDEQRAIADILDTAQREIELLEQLREQIQLQKRGLMQKLLTGEIRVKGDSVAV